MQLHGIVEIADRLDREVDILMQMREMEVTAETVGSHLALMVDQAKRVRRVSTLLIKALANERDNTATAQEGTST